MTGEYRLAAGLLVDFRFVDITTRVELGNVYRKAC